MDHIKYLGKRKKRRKEARRIVLGIISEILSFVLDSLCLFGRAGAFNFQQKNLEPFGLTFVITCGLINSLRLFP